MVEKKMLCLYIFVIFIALIAIWLPGHKQKVDLQQCADNLEHIGIAMSWEFREEDNVQNLYPSIDPRPGYLTLPINKFIPEYLTDPYVMMCPVPFSDIPTFKHDTEASYVENYAYPFDHSSYYYLGYLVLDGTMGKEYIDAYKRQATTSEGLDANLVGDDGINLIRLGENMEQYFNEELGSPASQWALLRKQVPLMIEAQGHHRGGAHVLFMDGHVEFRKYPGKFPMTVEFITGLQSLNDLRNE